MMVRKYNVLSILLVFISILPFATLTATAVPSDLKGQVFFADSPSGLGWDFSIWAIDLETMQSRRVIDLTGKFFRVNELDVSSDGKRLLIAGEATEHTNGDLGDMEIWVVNTDGTHLQPATDLPNPATAAHVVWSAKLPNVLYFLYGPNPVIDPYNVRKLDLNFNPPQVTDYFPNPACSDASEGMDITNDDASAIFVPPYSVVSAPLLPPGSSCKTLQSSNGRRDICPRVNRQDGWIVWQEEVHNNGDGIVEIFKMDPNGQNVTAITGHPEINNRLLCPVWAGDHENGYVIFSTDQFSGGQQLQLVAMHPNPGDWDNAIQLASRVGGTQQAPAWTPHRQITLFPTTLSGGTLHGKYSRTITASGGTGPYTFQVSENSLPPGLALNTAPDGSSCTIEGTLDQISPDGGFQFEIETTDSNGDHGWQEYAVEVAADSFSGAPSTCPNLAIDAAPDPLPTGTANDSYDSASFIASGGSGNYSYVVSYGNLPHGMTLDKNSGTLSGIPAASGTYTFTVSATDDTHCVGNRDFVLNVVNAACGTITLDPLAPTNSGIKGQPFGPSSITAHGCQSNSCKFAVSGAFPSGLSVSPPPNTFTSNPATISGSPTTVGIFGFSVTATDQNGCVGSRFYSISINSVSCSGTPITISPSAAPGANANVTYGFQPISSGGTGACSFSIQDGVLPSGLTFQRDNGSISGEPSSVGDFPFIIVATDQNECMGSAAYTIPVAYTPLSNYFSDNIRDEAWTYSGTAWNESNGDGAQSGILKGTDNSSGSEAIATQFAGCSNPCTIETTMTTDDPGNLLSLIAWRTDALNYVELQMDQAQGMWRLNRYIGGFPNPIANRPRPIIPGRGYPVRLEYNGIKLDAYIGCDPTPMSVTIGGGLSGTVGFTMKGTTGSFDKMIVTQTYGSSGCGMELAPESLPHASTGTFYSQSIDASGGVSPYSYALTGTLPPGLSFNIDTISGTPAAGGTFSFTITATDSDGFQTSHVYTLIISPCTFCDDFSDFNTSFGLWTMKPSGSYSIIGGDAIGSTTKKADLFSPNFGGCTDCTFESLGSINTTGGRLSTFGWYKNSHSYVELRLYSDKQRILFQQKQLVGGKVLKAVKKVSFPVQLNHLYHIVVNYSSGQFTVSIDGVQQSGLTMSSVATPSGNAMFRVKSTTGALTKGTIADLKIY